MNEIVKFIYPDGGGVNFDVGLVIGCDPGIGITIVNADDTDEFLYCLIGPLAPNAINIPGAEEYYKEDYKKEFDSIRLRIGTGVVDIVEHCRILNLARFTEEPLLKHCPFGQQGE